MKYKKISSYVMNSESPFVEELFNMQVSHKRRIVAGKDPNYIVNKDGEVQGVQRFVVHEKVDKEQFTKVFRQGLIAMFGLSKSGIKVFSFIASIAKPNKDEIIFDLDTCKEFTGYRTHAPIITGLSELIENGFIARSKKHYRYFINPNMFFNGSRVAFIKMYQKDDENWTTLPSPNADENT